VRLVGETAIAFLKFGIIFGGNFSRCCASKREPVP
jgi:hypothetical protein